MKAHELIAVLAPDSALRNLCTAAVKFDLGDNSSVDSMASVSTKTFHDLPAPICLFEADAGTGTVMVLAQKKDAVIEWRSFVKMGQWIECDLIFKSSAWNVMTAERRGACVDIEAMALAVEAGKKEWPIELRAAKAISNLIKAVEVFSCSNVKTVEHSAPKFINQKRITKGKVPFFSYHTLEITGEVDENGDDDPTGHHESPRLHLCRGHIKRLKQKDGSIRRVWWRAHLRGDKSKGFAHKDYKVALKEAPCLH